MTQQPTQAMSCFNSTAKKFRQILNIYYTVTVRDFMISSFCLALVYNEACFQLEYKGSCTESLGCCLINRCDFYMKLVKCHS